MARTPKANPSTSTEVTNWEEDLARDAKIAAAQEAHVGGGNFFSTKAGVLSVDKQTMPNNEIAVVVIDGIIENAWYPGIYDADNPAPPTCYAFGREEADMTPHPEVKKDNRACSDMCKDCDKNEFGSAETGRGKACKNTRRLALIKAGELDKRSGEFTANLDPENYSKTDIRYLRVPPTSIGAYAAYVKQLANGLKRPPYGVFTRISLHPHPTKQWEMRFEALEEVPNNLMSVVMTRHKREMEAIEFPYPAPGENTDKKPAPKTSGRKFTR